MKSAILINPPSGMYIRDDRCQVPAKGLSSGLRTPLDLAYMAAILEKENFECVIRDYPAENKTWQAFKKDIEDNDFNILIISATTPTLYTDLLACDIAKEKNPNILTVAKGAHFAAEDMEVMEQVKNLDISIRGEYELAVGELGQNKPLEEIPGITYRENGRIRRNPSRPTLENMDILPLPARHLLNNRLYVRPDTGEMMTSIQTNRGCPARCVYCLVRTVSGSKIIARSPESIVNEMQVCKEQFGITNFYFRADTFTWDKEWMMNVCRSIVERKLDVCWVCNSRVDTIDRERLGWLKKAGCWMIGFGIESGDQDILNKMKKGTTLKQAHEAVDLCNEFNIKTYLFWVLGLPWETEASLKNTLKFAQRIKGDFAEFHIAYPFPGTEFYSLGLENNLFSKEDLYKGDVKEGIVKSFSLSRQRLRYYQRRITKGYYLSPARIIKLLKDIHSPAVLLNYIKKGLLVLGNLREEKFCNEEE
jgi:radical SAM superfamily enzyme YgiQ (UPF0313 family)